MCSRKEASYSKACIRLKKTIKKTQPTKKLILSREISSVTVDLKYNKLKQLCSISVQLLLQSTGKMKCLQWASAEGKLFFQWKNQTIHIFELELMFHFKRKQTQTATNKDFLSCFPQKSGRK